MKLPVYPERNALLAPGLMLGLLALGATLMAQAGQTPPAQTPSVPTTAKQPAPPAATKATDKEYGDLQFLGHYTYDGNTNILVGNEFVYTRGEATTTGDRGTFKRIDKKTNDGILDAEGHLIYDDPQHHATCNKAHVDMIAKLAVFTESVVLLLKPDKAGPPPPAAAPPTPSAQKTAPPNATAQNATTETADNGIGDQKKRGATVYCDRMEDQYKKKYIKLYGHVLFKQSYKNKDGKQMERVLTAEHAEYNGKSETLLLFGPVDGHDGDGQEVHTPNQVTVGTKEGQETLDGIKVSFKFLPSEETTDDDNADAKDAKGADGGKAKAGTDKNTPNKGGTDGTGAPGKGQR